MIHNGKNLNGQEPLQFDRKKACSLGFWLEQNFQKEVIDKHFFYRIIAGILMTKISKTTSTSKIIKFLSEQY